MHDPMTVAFEVRLPPLNFWRVKYWERLTKGYWPNLITIWHVDPETDGSDDSCGWSYPKLTKKQKDVLGHLAYCEKEHPWFQRDPVKEIDGAADAEFLMRGAFQMVAYSLRLRLSWQESCELACRYTHNSADNFRGSLCHLPGWHTNFKEDLKSEREDHAMGFFCSIAKIILRRQRPWYKHPKWHIWHWKLQIPVIQNFKRWMWSRCSKCGKGFKWGEAPCTSNWNCRGPMWFKSESDVYHSGCQATFQVADTIKWKDLPKAEIEEDSDNDH